MLARLFGTLYVAASMSLSSSHVWFDVAVDQVTLRVELGQNAYQEFKALNTLYEYTSQSKQTRLCMFSRQIRNTFSILFKGQL